eukprot:365032-Chlamydomonas_euryale.AAC.24
MLSATRSGNYFTGKAIHLYGMCALRSQRRTPIPRRSSAMTAGGTSQGPITPSHILLISTPFPRPFRPYAGTSPVLLISTPPFSALFAPARLPHPLTLPAPLLRLDLKEGLVPILPVLTPSPRPFCSCELVQPKRVSLLSRLPLKLHRRAARPCGRLGAPEALIGLKPLRANRAVLSAAAVLVVATRLRAVQRAGARAVGKQRLVVHTVRVLGAKAGAHALVLVEQPLVVHDLPAANLCHPERDLLADVAVAVSRKLGLFRSAVRAAVPGFEAALALALAPPLLAQLVALPPRLALLTRLVVARRRRRQVQTVVVHAAATIAAASAAGRRRRVGAWLRMPAAATAELAAWQGRWLARVHARRHAERATLLQARLRVPFGAASFVRVWV